MVPVRLLSEASGYTVCWDGHRQTAVIVDAESLAAEIDQSFTYINSILAARLADAQGKRQQTDTTFTAANTIYQEEKEAISFPVSGELTSYTDGTAWRIDAVLNVKDALQALLAGDSVLLSTMKISLRTALQADLSKLTATMILDQDGGIYLRAPVLLELLTGQAMADNAWVCLGNLSRLGVDMEAITGGTMTVGSMLVNALLTDDTAFMLTDILEMTVPMLEAVYGDSTAKKNGDVYTWELDLNAILLAAGLAQAVSGLDGTSLTGSLTADARGNYSITADFSTAMETGGMSLSLDASGTASDGTLSFKLSLTDLFDLELSARQSTRTVLTVPSLSLPKDAVVVDLYGDPVPAAEW
jgi:hypothetical protein